MRAIMRILLLCYVHKCVFMTKRFLSKWIFCSTICLIEKEKISKGRMRSNLKSE